MSWGRRLADRRSFYIHRGVMDSQGRTYGELFERPTMTEEKHQRLVERLDPDGD